MIIPKNFNILVTKKCNFKCITCQNWKNLNPKHSSISLETYDKVFKEYKQLNSKGSINFVGIGEPLLYPNIYELITLANKSHTVIVTNGSQLNQSNINEFLATGITQINFSLNSHIPYIHNRSRGVEGSYDHIVNMIKLINNQCKVCVNTILSNWNFDHYLDFIEFLKKLPITEIGFNLEYGKYIQSFNPKIKDILSDIIKDPKIRSSNLEDYYRLIDNRQINSPCKISNTRITLDLNGNLSICEKRFNYVLGNIKQESFEEIMNKKITQKFLEETKKCYEYCALNNCNY